MVSKNPSSATREITFIVREDDGGGYTANAHWPEGNRDLHTEGDTREELLRNIREAIDASFDEGDAKPNLIHLHYIRDEVVARSWPDSRATSPLCAAWSVSDMRGRVRRATMFR